jgi:hypothetical protein
MARYYCRKRVRARARVRIEEEWEGVQMEVLLLWIGRLAALGGILMCALAAYGRLTGAYFAAGFQIGTLLMAGMALMIAACIALLLVLTGRPRR